MQRYTMPTSQADARRSFTLVELTVVLVILAILAAVAVPRFSSSIAHQRLESAVRRVVSDLNLVQAHARARSESHTIVFDVASNSYSVDPSDGGAPSLTDMDSPTKAYTVELSDKSYEATLDSVDFGGDNEIVFDGYGVPDSGGSLYVAVSDRKVKVSVDAETGRVSRP